MLMHNFCTRMLCTAYNAGCGYYDKVGIVKENNKQKSKNHCLSRNKCMQKKKVQL